MSDDGSANFTPPCCEYPVPHSGVGSFGEAETVSISARTDDFSDVFDWDLYYARRKSTTDVTSPSSNVPSEGRPAAGISSHQEDSPMPDVAPHDPKPPHVWPRVPDPQPPRDLEVQLESSPSPSPATEMRVGGYAHIPSGPDQKRTRVVVNPGKTNEVRQAGSCYYCKMSKTGCDASSVCGPCSKRPLGELACIRKPLKDINTSVMTRWNWNEPNATIPSRGQLDERRPYPIFISVSERIESPCLEVEVCPYTLPSHQEHGEAGIRRFGIRWDERRSEAMIYHWMEEQILAEKSTDFETQMDKLLCCFVRRLERGAPPEGEHISMLHQTAQITETLLSKILKMRCMWKVWSCKQFFVRKHPGARWQPISPFDSSFASVQASLRQLAAEAISQLERQILSELAAYIAKGPARDVRKWLLLWQLILLYRQSLRWMLEQQLSEQQRTNAAPIAIGAMPVNEKRHIFRETTMRLLNAITVLYSGKFTKQTTVKAIRDAKAEAFGDDRQLHLMFQTAWQALGEFYQQVLRQVSPTDDLFKACIVEKELGILEMGRPARN